MRRFRWWLVAVLLELARRACPAKNLAVYEHERRVWQIIEVPRRISETEGRQLARQVANL